MSKTKASGSLFERLQKGLEEGIEHARGKLELKCVELPARPPRVEKEDVIALRRRLDLNPQEFSHLLNVPLATVKLWETGQRKPSHAALRLIQIYVELPDVPKELARATALQSKRRISSKKLAGTG